MSSVEMIGSLAGGAAIVVPLVKYFISDWFKQQKEIENLKKERMKNIFNRLERDLDGVGEKMRRLEGRLQSYEKTNIENQLSIDNLGQLIKRSTEQAEKIAHGLNGKVREEVRSEVVKLREHLVMIKTKRSQGNGS